MRHFFSNISSKYKFQNWSPVTWILVLSLAVILPIPFMGIPDNFDLLQHLRFARTFYEGALTADMFPSWGANDNAGLGSVGVRFYPPLAYLTMAFAQLVTQSWFDTLWTNLLLWMVTGCLGVYFWSREWLEKPQAAAAGIVYAVVPYHLLQIYQAFLFAEFAAAAILPFCFLFATRIVKNGRFSDTVLFAISFSALVLTHIPSTIIGSISLGIYILLLPDLKRFGRTASRFAIALTLSLLATSFYWLRLLTELSWVKHNLPQFYGAGYYNYTRYFFPMFMGSRELYIQRSLWTFDIVIVLTFLLFLPLCIVAALNFKSRKSVEKNRFPSCALLISGIFVLFMMSYASSFIWHNVSFLQKLQFPWRWLSVASLFGSLAFVLGTSELVKRGLGRKIVYPAAILIFVILLYDISQQIIPSTPLPRETLSAQLQSIDSEAACECWWPVWATRDAFSDLQSVGAGLRPVTISKWDGLSRQFTVEAGDEAKARIAIFYYPHWRAEVNGKLVEIEQNIDGTMSIPLSPVASNVRIYFQEPLHLQIAKFVSIFTMIALVLVLPAIVLARRTQRTS